MALMLLQTRISPSSDESTDSTSMHQLSSTGAGVVNGMVIAICSRVMSHLVLRLTNYEVPAALRVLMRDDVFASQNWTLEDGYNSSLVFKFFYFECVNNYSSTLFTAFLVAGGTLGQLGGDGLWGSTHDELCSENGCVANIGNLGVSLLVSKYVFGLAITLIEPRVVFLINKKLYSKGKSLEPFVQQHESSWWEIRNIQPEDAFCCKNGFRDSLQQMADICVTIGYTTMFTFAFPLAPVVSVLGLTAKFGVDAYNFTNQYRRPFRGRSEGYSAWLGLMHQLTLVSVFMGAMLVLITSDFMSDQFPDKSSEWHVMVVTYIGGGLLAILIALRALHSKIPREMENALHLDNLERHNYKYS